MSLEQIILLCVAVVGVMQTANLLLVNRGMDKIQKICIQMTDLQKQLGGKAETAYEDVKHEKIDIKLGRFGDRILKLELKIKPEIVSE